MRIERIRIDGFGRFSEVEFGPLAGGVTVIHGPNEAGKSTLHAFVRAILFGFPRRGSPDWIAPDAGGRHGGRIALLGRDGERYLVERHGDVQRGAARVTLPDGTHGDDGALMTLLGGVSADVYRAVFAFGLDELQSLNSLPAEAVSGRIYAAGFGAEQLPEAAAHFQRRAAEIFLPRGRVQPVAGLLRELEEVDRELAAARALVESYHQLVERRDRTASEARHLESRLTRIEDFQRRAALLDRNLEAAREQFERARAELDDAERALATRDGEIAGDEDAPDPSVLRVQIDELREAWTRLQASHRMIAVYHDTVARQRLPRGPWLLGLLIAGTILPLLIGGLTGHTVVIGVGIALAALGMVTLVLAAIARSRYEAAQRQARRHLELTHRDAEGRFLHAASATGINPERAPEEIERLEAELETARSSRASQAEIDELRELAGLRRRRVESAAAELGEGAQAADHASAEWAALAGRLGVESGIAPAQARALVEEQRDELLVERGRLDERLRQFETETQAAELRARRELLLTELRDQAREWAVNVAAGALLREARRVYEEQRQPAVLRAASDAFDAMTLGAYHELLVPEGDDAAIAALTRDGRRVDAGRMSRGTRDQAYLALRLGLIREFGARVLPLPVLIDDVLVNCDPARAAEAMRAFVALARSHQVLVFTCHPSTVALARFIDPAAQVITLDEQKIPGLEPVWVEND